MSKFRHHADFVVEHRLLLDPTDRRAETRYPSQGNLCWIGWRQAGASRIITASLRDISRSGAGIRGRPVPPAGSPVWFCPKEPGQAEWIEGIVVRVSPPGILRILLGTPYEIGLHFRQSCTWETLRAALFGLGGPPIEVDAAPPPLPRSGGSES